MALTNRTGTERFNQSDIEDQLSFKKYAELFDADPKNLKRGPEWYDEEYNKQVQTMRDRYPLLSQLLLRGSPLENANLSDIETTNKYARLADAYNAQMRYRPSGIQVGFGTWANGTNDNWVPVNKLETQDQKQMDQLRSAQGDLRQHQLKEESAYQQDFLKRKMDEMSKLVDQGYQMQFFEVNEQMRRIKELFDSWRKMNESEFDAVMKEIGIPEKQWAKAYDLLQAGDYIGYAHMMEYFGQTPYALDQLYMYKMTGDTIGKMIRGEITDPNQIASALQQVSARYVVEGLYAFLDLAKDPYYNSRPEYQKAANAIRGALGKLGGAAEWTSDHLGLVLGGLFASGILKEAAGILLPLFTKGAVKI
jgi:hypothetical protein